MTDNDKHIVQILKYHIEAEDCVSCEAFGKCDEFILTEKVLDLINRQKADVERLKSRNNFLEIEYKNQGNLFWERVEGAKSEAIK